MRVTTWIKRLLYPLYIYPRTTKGTRTRLHELFEIYRQKRPLLQDTTKGLKLFSNLEEDGIILKLIAHINKQEGFFIDIGSNDCINSNCANLAFNFNWAGVFIDADTTLLNIGQRNYKWFGKKGKLKFVNSFLNAENVNNIIIKHIDNREVDFVSIDIDGNDYEIWKAITSISPKIVVIENKIEFGHYNIVVPVNRGFSNKDWGASITAITDLSKSKGYTLVAVNNQGFNAFYLRNDVFAGTGLSELKIKTVMNDNNINSSFYDNERMQKLICTLQQ